MRPVQSTDVAAAAYTGADGGFRSDRVRGVRRPRVTDLNYLASGTIGKESTMKKDTFAPGEPCWIDCGTDLTKGPQFYADLFGWTIQGLGEEAGGYSMAIKGDVEVAGFGPQQNPGTPMWSVYFHTDDATKTAELVTSNGGTVLFAPMQVMEAGHLAIFADPQGAACSLTGMAIRFSEFEADSDAVLGLGLTRMRILH